MTARAGGRVAQFADPGRSRLPGADALRAVALLAVVAIHTAAWGPAIPFQTIDRIARFSVPAFVILTGTVLAYRYTGRPLGAGFARRRLARTLVPWIVWMPVFMWFDIVLGALTPRTSTVTGFLAQGGGHLWFLLLIPQFYLLFAVWPRRHRWAIAAAALALQTALCVIRLYVALPGWESQVMLTYANEIFPFWIGYFAVGVAVGDSMRRPGMLRRALNLWRWRIACLAAVATAGTGYLLVTVHFPGAAYGPQWLTGTGAFLNPLLPFFVFAVGGVIATSLPPLLRAWRPLARTVSVLSDESLGIYIVHPILLYFVATYLAADGVAHGGVTSLLMWTAFVLLTVVVSLGVVRLLRATPLAATLGATYAPLPLRRSKGSEDERAA